LSILTKIGIVIIVVLVLLACPVFITQASVAANYRHLYEKQKDYGVAMEQTARQGRIAVDRLNTELAQTRSAHGKEKETLESTISGLQNDLAKAETRHANLEGQLKIAIADLNDLRISQQSDVKFREDLQGRLDKARANIDSLNSQVRQLSNKLKDAEGRYELARLVERTLRERLEQKDRRISDLEEQLEAAGQVVKVAPTAEEQPLTEMTQITGEITAVTDTGLASINIGSAKGVKRGMKLIVYRQGDFVGYLQIGEVDVDQAAGVVTEKRLDVKQGDKVTNILKR
jgi:DNA repair exonuclease SbcCD ATPase subunit